MMSKELLGIINRVRSIADHANAFGLNPVSCSLTKDEHNYLANYCEGKYLQGSAREKDDDILKSYLGVELVIVDDKEKMKVEDMSEFHRNQLNVINGKINDLEKKHSETLASHSRKMTNDFNRLNMIEKKLIELEKHINTKFTVNPITDKLELLLPNQKRLTEILREQLPNHDVEVRFVGNVSNYMSAKEAMNALFDGYKVTRKAWADVYVMLGDVDSVYISEEDLEANDWYIV